MTTIPPDDICLAIDVLTSDGWYEENETVKGILLNARDEILRLRGTLRCVVKEARRQNGLKWGAVESFTDYIDFGVKCCAAGPWRNVNTDLPKEGVTVLAKWGSGDIETTYFHRGLWFPFYRDDDDVVMWAELHEESSIA